MLSPRVVREALSGIAGKRILVVGDVMLDRYVEGDVKRLCPEAPVPILSKATTQDLPGGAANVARNLHEWGARAILVSVLGHDREAVSLITAMICERHFFVSEKGRPTTVKKRFVGSGHLLMRHDEEVGYPIAQRSATALMAEVKHVLPKCDGVLLSDYGKGVLTEDVLEQIIGFAGSHEKPVVVDPKGKDYRRYAGATVITPNVPELCVASGRHLETENEIVGASIDLVLEVGAKAVMTTRGRDGYVLAMHDQTAFVHPAVAEVVVDVTGAGDTVAAMMIAAMSTGNVIPFCAELANLAAGVVVGKRRTATASPTEIVRALE